MAIGERIAEERKRLGLSQAAFADLVGVSFSSQRRYENDSRSPDTGYLGSLRKHGIDVEYVISGRAKYIGSYDHDFLAEFGLAIAKLYQISPDELNSLVKAVEAAMKDEPEAVDSLAIERRIASFEATFFVFAADFFTKKLRIVETGDASESIDSTLLAQIIHDIESALSREGILLDSQKKSQATAMLYRSFKASGKFDPVMIEETVKLAAG